ncbi:MAG TPA: hypothetical protein PKM41_08405 [Deltaproteobacteria bacterium]|jgi:hypothetical protein|nr:hypothetical protein [Deltaproteobacteria bacterium]HOI07356.1 hypothetical protein [Deltaproteobacteria bacterium]
MTRILKPVSGKAAKYLGQICAQYFRESQGLRAVEYDLGNAFTGRIDLLATDGTRNCLVTIGTADFAHDLFRSLTGYRWFRENHEFLSRVYGRDEIDLSLPLRLVILSQELPADAPGLCSETIAVPIELYRYRLYGSGDDPDISVELLWSPEEGLVIPEDFDALRRDLGIEAACLTDGDIRDFRKALGL